jgi:hypothetical protein
MFTRGARRAADDSYTLRKASLALGQRGRRMVHVGIGAVAGVRAHLPTTAPRLATANGWWDPPRHSMYRLVDVDMMHGA